MKQIHHSKARRALALILSLAMLLPLLSFGSFAADPETVKLAADSSEAITVGEGENKILDLAGHTLSATVTNNGTLTIIDSVGGGKIGFTTSAGDVQAAVHNYGTLTLDGAAISVATTVSGTYPTGIFNYSGASLSMKSGSIQVVNTETSAAYCYGIINEGTVTEISGGSISALKYNATTGYNIMCINNRKGGVIELISGGTMYTCNNGKEGQSIGIRNQGSASVKTITGGSITAISDGPGTCSAYGIYNNNGSIGTIYGGKIYAECNTTSSGTGAVAYGIHNETGTVTEIAGGQIAAVTNGIDYCFGVRNAAGQTIKKISGGLIEAYCNHQKNAPNCIAIANWGRIDEISGGTMYAESINNSGFIIGLRNQNNTASVGKISGGKFIAKVTNGSGCKAFGIYNQGGLIEEITDGLFYGSSVSGQWAFGLWNAATINKISGGTFVGEIDHDDNDPNAIGLSNDGTVKEITGGVYYAKNTHPSGGTYAIRNKNTIGSLSGGAFGVDYACASEYQHLLTEGGTTTYASGYAMTTGYAKSGYKYVIPTGATVDEAYVESEALKVATVTKDSAKVAEYKLYGTTVYVASVHNGTSFYTSVEEACSVIGFEDGIVLLTNVKEAVIPAGNTVFLDLAGYHVTDVIAQDDAVVTVSDGFIDGTITGNVILENVAAKGEVPADAVADGYTVTEKTDAGYAYVIPEGGSVVELYDGDTLLAVRIFDKDGKVATTLGSTAKDGFVLVGWSDLKGVEPTVADADVTGETAVLYGTWIRQPLYYFLGSSVTYGSATGGRSFVEEIAELYPIAYDKQAISGTTLVDSGANSYVQRLVSRFDPDIAPDRLIVQLSTNDASQNKPLGTVSDSKNSADFDTTTVIGAMEFIIAYAKETWDCPVAFYTNPYYNNATYEKMIDALYELQEKWDIMIFDFYYYVDMEELSAATLSSYMADSIHPNATGYKWMAGIMGEMLMEADHADSEHAGVHVTTDPTCTEKGHTDYECVICGKTVTASETEANDHDYVDGVCTECGASDPDYVPPVTEDPDPVIPPETGDVLMAVAILATVAALGVAIASKKRRTN
ncbi:MAG: SGNH/GDSL hydrolase family protein [Clostridia bacterium]|nr:SGNH/GDSL hydrolase family protein [Clostridia bacterium]